MPLPLFERFFFSLTLSSQYTVRMTYSDELFLFIDRCSTSYIYARPQWIGYSLFDPHPPPPWADIVLMTSSFNDNTHTQSFRRRQYSRHTDRQRFYPLKPNHKLKWDIVIPQSAFWRAVAERLMHRAAMLEWSLRLNKAAKKNEIMPGFASEGVTSGATAMRWEGGVVGEVKRAPMWPPCVSCIRGIPWYHSYQWRNVIFPAFQQLFLIYLIFFCVCVLTHSRKKPTNTP